MISDIKKDPFGMAVWDFHKENNQKNIIVCSELCEEDVIPVEYLFRNYQNMPLIEQKAMDMSFGKVLDVGAGAGCHSIHLKNQAKDVFAIDISVALVQFYKSQNINSECIDFFDLNKKFDTILFMMNGIGLGGKLNNLDKTLFHAKKILNKNGVILCDSTDIKYLYEDEDGSFLMDLNAEYYGEFKFQTKYKDAVSEWFNWVYVDFEKLKKIAFDCGLNCTKVIEGDHFNFLAKIEHL